MLKKGTWLRFHWGWEVVGKEGDERVGGRKEGEVESVSCCFSRPSQASRLFLNLENNIQICVI